MGNMLSLRCESGPARWEFGILLLHRWNITMIHTSTNIMLFSIKGTDCHANYMITNT